MLRGAAVPGRQVFGRDAQLEVVAAHLDELGRSRGGLLLLAGEPGIGKSRLAEAVVDLARARGASTAWATAWDGDGVPALWPWMQIVRQLGQSADALDHAPPQSLAASPAARFEQLETVTSHLRRAAASAPLVVVIDDLHWAGAASISMLRFAASMLRDVGCLFVATYRTGELASDDLARLAGVGTTIALPRLSASAAADLLRTAVGAEVSPVVVNAVVSRSGGIPLFVWEFGQLLAQSGRLDVAPAAVPDAVAAVLERRLARLKESSVELLRVAAVAGKAFSAVTVAAMSERSLDRTIEELGEASAVGVVLGPGVDATFEFTHDLIRDVVLDSIGPGRRADLHRRAAAALGPLVERDPSLHAVVAHHLECAGPSCADAASAQWELGARRALSVLAHDEAAHAFARAASAVVGDPGRRAELLVAEGEALLLAGTLDAARDRFVEAVTLARSVGKPELATRAVLGIGAGPDAWEVPLASDEHVALLADVLVSLPDESQRERSMLLARLSVTGARPGASDVSRRRASEALALAEQVGDPALIAQALAAVNDAHGGPAHTMMRRSNADTIVELAAIAGDRVLELLGYRFRVVADLELGDLAAVDRDIAAFARLAHDLHQPLISWYVPLFRGMRALLDGDLDRADRCSVEVGAAAEATGSRNARMMAVTLALGVDVARRRVPDVEEFETLVDVDPSVWASWAAGLAFVSWLGGSPGSARDLLRLHADDGFARLSDDSEYLTTLTMFGRVATGVGDTGAMSDLYDRLRPHSGLWAVDGIAGCCWGPVDLELARLAVALDRPADARAHLTDARRDVARAGAPLLMNDVEVLERHCEGASSPLNAPVEAPPQAAQVFRCDGQFWTLTHHGHTTRMKDAKGLHDLAQLLARPGQEVHVHDLVGVGHDEAGRALARAGDLGELLDARARAAYRRRLAEIEDELADAEADADLGRAEKARDERDFIVAELSAALGLGGRPRRAGDPTERARKAVTARIRLTIGRIGAEDVDLARHLTNSIRTGTYCVYQPETPMVWVVERRSGIAIPDVAPRG